MLRQFLFNFKKVTFGRAEQWEAVRSLSPSLCCEQVSLLLLPLPVVMCKETYNSACSPLLWQSQSGLFGFAQAAYSSRSTILRKHPVILEVNISCNSVHHSFLLSYFPSILLSFLIIIQLTVYCSNLLSLLNSQGKNVCKTFPDF